MEGKTAALVVMVFAFDLVAQELSSDHAWTQENLGRWKLKVIYLSTTNTFAIEMMFFWPF